MRVIGYARLSKAEEGHGLSVQRKAIEAYCERRGLELLRVEEDNGASGRSTRKRPGLAAALEACRSEGCSAIVSTRVDRLARSSLDFHRVVEAVTRSGATILFSEQESSRSTHRRADARRNVGLVRRFRERSIAARTKAALAIVRRNGSKSGRPIGNPSWSRIDPEIEVVFLGLRCQGFSYRKIAETLNGAGDPHRTGGGEVAPPNRPEHLQSI